MPATWQKRVLITYVKYHIWFCDNVAAWRHIYRAGPIISHHNSGTRVHQRILPTRRARFNRSTSRDVAWARNISSHTQQQRVVKRCIGAIWYLHVHLTFLSHSEQETDFIRHTGRIRSDRRRWFSSRLPDRVSVHFRLAISTRTVCTCTCGKRIPGLRCRVHVICTSLYFQVLHQPWERPQSEAHLQHTVARRQQRTADVFDVSYLKELSLRVGHV